MERVFLILYSLLLLFLSACLPVPEAPLLKAVNADWEPRENSTNPAVLSSVSVNTGDIYTNSYDVSVSFTVAAEVSSICISENADVSSCTWGSDLTSPKTYSMTGSDGVKNIYVWVKDASGVQIGQSSDSIILDLTLPTVFTVDLPDSYSTINSYTFSWSASTDATSGIAYYNVRACQDMACGSNCTAVTTTTSTSATISGLIEGASYYGCVQAVDNAGNTFPNPLYEDSVEAVTIDSTPPTINSITNSVGTITNQINTNYLLSVTDAAQMYITNDEADCQTTTIGYLTFVAGISNHALTLNATNVIYFKFIDSAGNETSCVSDTIVQDSVVPTVTIEQSAGQNDPTNNPSLSYTVTFSEEVTGFTSADISVGGTATCSAPIVTGSGAAYTITMTATTDGSCIPSIAASMATDLAGNGNSASTSTDNSVTYDGTSPYVVDVTSSKANGFYPAGTSIPITMTFNEVVIVTGTPNLTLETGTVDQTIDYTSGSGTDTLTFNYTVSAGDNSNDLDYLDSMALFLNGGFIKDEVGNTASITLPAPGAAGSLSMNKDIVIDTTPPDPATAQTWLEVSPYNGLTVNASWTRSVSADLANQKIQFYANSGCSNYEGGLIDLASNIITSQSLTGVDGGTYAYRIVSYDYAGNYISSACSALMTLELAGSTPADMTWDAGGLGIAGDGPPAARKMHTAVWTGSKLIIWGGTADGTTGLSNGSMYDPVAGSWTAVSATGAPSGRWNHSAIWTGTHMIIWGGRSGASSTLADGFKFDPTTNTWTTLPLTGAPATLRGEHTAVWTGDKMIIWGGKTGSATYKNDGAIYDDIGQTWTSMTLTNLPAAREAHVAIWDGTYMTVYGGANGGGVINTGGVYDPVLDTWTTITMTGGPSTGRRNHVGVYDSVNGKTLFWSGYDGVNRLGEGYSYDTVGDSWTAISVANEPLGRNFATAVWTGTYMIVWGGIDTTAVKVNNGGIYDPATDSWTAWSASNSLNAPAARFTHTATWVGDGMIVFGGADASSVVLNDGGYFR